MKKILTVALLAAAPIVAYAAPQSWMQIQSKDGITTSLDRNSVKSLPGGAVSYWSRVAFARWVEHPVANAALVMEHVTARCDDPATIEADAMVAKDYSGEVFYTDANHRKRAVVPGSVGADEVEAACGVAHRW
jgi:hypothetical protein